MKNIDCVGRLGLLGEAGYNAILLQNFLGSKLFGIVPGTPTQNPNKQEKKFDKQHGKCVKHLLAIALSFKFWSPILPTI